MDAILFYVFAAIAVASAVVVIGQRSPMYSAFALIVTLCSLSVIFALLGSPFIAALQVIVEEAGGRATTLAGERSIYAGSLVSTNGLLHDEALALLSA